jgi:hypothetical protein
VPGSNEWKPPPAAIDRFWNSFPVAAPIRAAKRRYAARYVGPGRRMFARVFQITAPLMRLLPGSM